MTLHRALVVDLALSGALGTPVLAFRSSLSVWQSLWDWPSLWIFGAIAGAVLGHLAWTFLRPRRRLSRVAAVGVLANSAVWVSFLIFSAPLATSEFARIDAERTQRDTLSGMDLMTDQPIVVAGRWHATFGAINRADLLLSLFAAPAIDFARLLVVPPRYIGADATKGESFAIAGLGFVWSTGFWTALGTAVSALIGKHRRRGGSARESVDRS
jgi:hypothetical protein